MGSHGSGSHSIVGTPTESWGPNPGPNGSPYRLARQGSFYSLTLDEVESQLGDLGKPFGSMNLDELLRTVCAVEGANSQVLGSVGHGAQPNQPSSGVLLNRTMSRELRKKTVDEVWWEITKMGSSSLDRMSSALGEITLEDFLVKAGAVAESEKDLGLVVRRADSLGLQNRGRWMNHPIPPVHPQPQVILPVYMPGHPGPTVMDGASHETQATMSSSSALMGGTLSDTQVPRRKRIAPDYVAEKCIERRQKRMIKNRESAARSRARKRAYTQELENKVMRLEEENERLRRLQALEKAMPDIPSPQQPKYRLRRMSSAPM